MISFPDNHLRNDDAELDSEQIKTALFNFAVLTWYCFLIFIWRCWVPSAWPMSEPHNISPVMLWPRHEKIWREYHGRAAKKRSMHTKVWTYTTKRVFEFNVQKVLQIAQKNCRKRKKKRSYKYTCQINHWSTTLKGTWSNCKNDYLIHTDVTKVQNQTIQ